MPRRFSGGSEIMKKMKVWLPAALVITAAAVFYLNSGSGDYSGSYTAVNPPVESGEMVIEQVRFEDGKLVMQSGDLEQAVDYTIADGNLVLNTDFGNFAFPFERTAAGFKIDGVDYQKD